MKTTSHIIVSLIALLMPAVAGANVYENRLKEAFDDIISAVSFPFSGKDASQYHTIYSNPETGVKEGQLDVYKFTIDNESIDLINNAKRVYEQMNGNSDADVFVLWWNDNDDGSFQGYRLYYNPDETIVVGMACDHSYTVGFVAPDDKQHRKTYTLEWSNLEGSDSITGRLITTYAPIKAKATEGHRMISSVVISSDDYDKYMEQFQAGMEKYQQGMEKYKSALEKAKGQLNDLDELSELSQNNDLSDLFLRRKDNTSSESNANDWIKKLLFYINKVQENGDRYLYLSKLYELCKNTDCLDQADLKIAMQQLASVYKQLKEKKKLKENELLFLESMVDLLENKTKSIHSWNPD